MTSGHGVANGSAHSTDPIQQSLNLIVIDKPRSYSPRGGGALKVSVLTGYRYQASHVI